jgi:hypothetical protein
MPLSLLSAAKLMLRLLDVFFSQECDLRVKIDNRGIRSFTGECIQRTPHASQDI